jgi:hypothetical protein
MENIQGGAIPAKAPEPAAQAEAAEVFEAQGGQSRRSGLVGFLNSRAALLVVGALLIGAVFWYLQFSTGSLCCGDYDAYYHFRWSRMLWEGMRAGHFPPSFDALPLTTLNPKDYVDHHFLFHVLQIPFTFFSDFQTGAKIGTWLFACLAVFSCYWLLVRNRVSYPLVWLVAVIGSSAPFLYRMNMGKAMSVSIVLLVAGIHLFFERKYRWLLPLAFVFALAYDMFALLVAAAAMWTFVILWSERRLEWRPSSSRARSSASSSTLTSRTTSNCSTSTSSSRSRPATSRRRSGRSGTRTRPGSFWGTAAWPWRRWSSATSLSRTRRGGTGRGLFCSCSSRRF